MTDTEKKKLKAHFPPFICLDQVRKILHISKRKAAWLLNNGIIPCTNSGKRTRQYLIDINDLIIYMETHEIKTSSTNISKNTFDNQTLTYIEPMPSEFREWLVIKWNLVKDAMTVSEVADLTGYSETTIKEWIAKKELKAVSSQTKQIIAKEWLLDFYLLNSYNIRWKSNKHLLLINQYFTENS